MERVPLVAAILVAVTAWGCTTNSPGHVGYESRAATTAERMVSPVGTGELLAQLGGEGRLLGPFAKTATTAALDEADNVQSAFDQVQPPDRRSNKLRNELKPLLQRANDELVDLRIAARKGDLEALGRFEHPLAVIAARLERFQREHEH
jgi:hypothetical protein